MIRRFLVVGCLATLLGCVAPSWAKTLVVEGVLDGRVTVTKDVTFSVEQPLSSFTYQFSVPAVYSNAGNVQRLDDFRVKAIPEPSEAVETTDQFGNRARKLIWKNLATDARVTVGYTTGVSAHISPRTSNAVFPLADVPQAERIFLAPTRLVQSDAPQVVALATRLTQASESQHQAVSAIMSHVADAVTYRYNPAQYDALYALTSGGGNCQNFSHLAVALLRAAGIPARVSIGQTLKDKWKIPLDRKGGSLVQGMGEGLHAWIEVWYPDLGWLPCDPQQSRLFTSTRHIKFGHGRDAADVLEYWSATPVMPRMSENFTAVYSADTVDLKLREALDTPSGYLLAGPVTALLDSRQGSAVGKQQSAVQPKPPAPPLKPLPVVPKPGTLYEFGNRDFPALVDVYQVHGSIGQRNFDRETAEYATSRHLFAQAFEVTSALDLKDVGLAMRKFGGDGTVYVDIVKDTGGIPGLNGFRSLPVSLETITRKPGYYWVNFTLPEQTRLEKGKYWLVLRHSGEAIMNWFYTPGKREGGPDDSRSTARGWQWEDVLSGEFVYRVRGIQGK